ncbi:MAG TPA: L-histidine N(alpha)-methyltransferase [Candidatus Deferrimicrobiaceae bacterium]|nr:L-histidine N(alpha)-methyltransferase [Candidatus Deferrimicrobiaceae bacterium]
MRYRLDIHTDERARQERLEADVRRGLTARQKSLPPKYFYDRAGSLLFERITELPEYYPTRTESALLAEIVPESIGAFLPDDIVEIGAGSSEKTRRILDAASAGGRDVRYVPLDVDRLTLEATAAGLLRDYPRLSVHAVVGDFERDLAHVPPPRGRRLALFLGSTIGNLDAPERRRLLAGLRGILPDRGDRLLLGVDLVKDVKLLEAAYDDAAGVTREFNRNILRVINRAVDGDFQPEAFRHRAFYNETASRIEMHLVADAAQTVKLGRLGLTLRFRPGEDIWTESSYKFTRAGVEAMLAGAGLDLVQWHVDPANYFALALAAPR